MVHSITNYVVMNNTANALLARGVAVMAHAEEEMAEMVGIASALVINIGTLSGPWVRACSWPPRRHRPGRSPPYSIPSAPGPPPTGPERRGS